MLTSDVCIFNKPCCNTFSYLVIVAGLMFLFKADEGIVVFRTTAMLSPTNKELGSSLDPNMHKKYLRAMIF